MSSNFDPQALSEFARYYGFHYDVVDPPTLVEDLLSHIERGLRGQASSLPMIPAYLTPAIRSGAGKTVIALDAGGTNLRSALVRFDQNGRPLLMDVRRAPMPGTRGRVDAQGFFDAIAALTVPLLEANPGVEGIGFTFSYPTEITRDADGILLALSKEVDAPEVIGKAVGLSLREALQRRKAKVPERIVLLNDTTATLLAGLSMLEGTGPVIGFILGTGLNTAYAEGRIPKIGFESEAAPQIVVCETGAFAHRYMGILDREFDAAAKNPGAYTLEKAVAGAYLGPLTHHVLKQAVRDGLLTFRRSEEFLALTGLSTADFSAFLRFPLAPEGPIGSLFDRNETGAVASVAYLASILTERGGLFAAAVLAATVRRLPYPNPLAPVRIAAEGATYLFYPGMRSAVEAHLHTLLLGAMPRAWTMAPVDHGSLLGAAMAAL